MGELFITEKYLQAHPDHIFVFGDNLAGVGYGGAARLRDMDNTYGFVTKISPGNADYDYYSPEDYLAVYCDQMALLASKIRNHPDKTFLISKVGAGLANRFEIWEKIIEPTIKPLLSVFPNVRFLWS